MFYGGNREAGRAVVNSYCKAKNHLQVPKPEQLLLPKPDISLNLPPLKMPPQPKPCVPVHLMKKILYSYLFRLPRWRAQRGSCDIVLLRSASPLPSFKVAGIKCSTWGGSEDEDSRLSHKEKIYLSKHFSLIQICRLLTNLRLCFERNVKVFAFPSMMIIDEGTNYDSLGRGEWIWPYDKLLWIHAFVVKTTFSSLKPT